MTLGRTAGLRLGVITGRESPALRRRMKEMSVELCTKNSRTKWRRLRSIDTRGVSRHAVAFLGDDLPDIP